MIAADWIVLCVLAAFAVFGAILGFGKGLKIFTFGIFGIVISVFVCYCFGGMILKLTFVQDMLNKIASLWTERSGFFFDLLTKIRLEVVIYYILLFIAAQMIRVGLVVVLKHVAETNLIAVKVINRVTGVVLFTGMAVLLGLAVFQFIDWVGGSTAEAFVGKLSGSALRLDGIFLNNPLAGLIRYIRPL